MHWFNVVNMWDCPGKLEMWDSNLLLDSHLSWPTQKLYSHYKISLSTTTLKVVYIHPLILKQTFLVYPMDHLWTGWFLKPKQTNIHQHQDSDKNIFPCMAGTP